MISPCPSWPSLPGVHQFCPQVFCVQHDGSVLFPLGHVVTTAIYLWLHSNTRLFFTVTDRSTNSFTAKVRVSAACIASWRPRGEYIASICSMASDRLLCLLQSARPPNPFLLSYCLLFCCYSLIQLVSLNILYLFFSFGLTSLHNTHLFP